MFCLFLSSGFIPVPEQFPSILMRVSTRLKNQGGALCRYPVCVLYLYEALSSLALSYAHSSHLDFVSTQLGHQVLLWISFLQTADWKLSRQNAMEIVGMPHSFSLRDHCPVLSNVPKNSCVIYLVQFLHCLRREDKSGHSYSITSRRSSVWIHFKVQMLKDPGIFNESVIIYQFKKMYQAKDKTN